MFIDTVLSFGSVVDVICTVHIKRCANRFFFFTAALLRVAQLGERRSAEREVAGSNPGWTNTQGLEITEKKFLPL